MSCILVRHVRDVRDGRNSVNIGHDDNSRSKLCKLYHVICWIFGLRILYRVNIMSRSCIEWWIKFLNQSFVWWGISFLIYRKLSGLLHHTEYSGIALEDTLNFSQLHILTVIIHNNFWYAANANIFQKREYFS